MILYNTALIVILLITLALTFSFMILYFTNEKQKHLLLWTEAWSAYFLGFIFLIIGSYFKGLSGFFSPAGEILVVINCYLLLYGKHLYDRKIINPLWPGTCILCCLWIIVIHFIDTDIAVKIIVPSVFYFMAYSYAGYLFIKDGTPPAPDKIIAGTLFILWGIHRLAFPFYWHDEKSRLTGLISGATLYILLSIFTILTYLQETRRNFLIEKQKAEEAERLKSSFLANMSHEIRTPLNVILGFTQLLSKPELSHEDRDLFIRNIKHSGENLLRLIDDILDLSKIESGIIKIYISDVSVNTVINDVISAASLSRNVIEKNLNLVAVKPLSAGEDIIRTDKTRLLQILSNLLNNAVKFTGEGTITLGYKLIQPDFIQFIIKDRGIGISEKAISKIFIPFFQEGKVAAAGGTGLGLSIAKGLIESLGGKIGIKSSMEEGTEISFTIPYIKGTVTQPLKSFTGSPDSYQITDKKILLVEDEPVNRKLMERFIESTGAKLISTESGIKSIKYCKEDSRIDLVLMDLTLPDIDGYNAISEIKKIRPGLPIIVQSANAMPEHREKARIAGADDFIAKPIKREELYSVIREQLFDRNGI